MSSFSPSPSRSQSHVPATGPALSPSQSFADEGEADSADEAAGGIDDWVSRSSGKSVSSGNAPSAARFSGGRQASASVAAAPGPASRMHTQRPSLTSAPALPRSGWLEKRGHVNTAWKKRWFVLATGNLTWYETPAACKKGNSSGSALVAGAEITELEGEEGELAARSFALKIVGDGGKTHALRASSKGEKNGWIASLEKHSGEAEKTAPVTFLKDELCYGCRKTFTLVRRRHHCRSCAHAFCAPCSSKKIRLPSSGVATAVRVCNDCHDTIQSKLAKLDKLQAEQVAQAAAEAESQLPPEEEKAVGSSPSSADPIDDDPVVVDLPPPAGPMSKSSSKNFLEKPGAPAAEAGRRHTPVDDSPLDASVPARKPTAHNNDGGYEAPVMRATQGATVQPRAIPMRPAVPAARAVPKQTNYSSPTGRSHKEAVSVLAHSDYVAFADHATYPDNEEEITRKSGKFCWCW